MEHIEAANTITGNVVTEEIDTNKITVSGSHGSDSHVLSSNGSSVSYGGITEGQIDHNSVIRSGSTMTGDIEMGGNKLITTTGEDIHKIHSISLVQDATLYSTSNNTIYQAGSAFPAISCPNSSCSIIFHASCLAYTATNITPISVVQNGSSAYLRYTTDGSTYLSTAATYNLIRAYNINDPTGVDGGQHWARHCFSARLSYSYTYNDNWYFKIYHKATYNNQDSVLRYATLSYMVYET